MPGFFRLDLPSGSAALIRPAVGVDVLGRAARGEPGGTLFLSDCAQRRLAKTLISHRAENDVDLNTSVIGHHVDSRQQTPFGWQPNTLDPSVSTGRRLGLKITSMKFDASAQDGPGGSSAKTRRSESLRWPWSQTPILPGP